VQVRADLCENPYGYVAIIVRMITGRNRPMLALLALAFAAACASAASAQDAGQVGITMGYPGSIGVMWHITDAVAVRPDFDFRATSESGRTDASSIGIGISGLWYFARHDALAMYVAPRYLYSRSTSETQISLPQNLPGISIGIGTVPSFTSTLTTHSLVGSFGAQYAIHKRFGIFGEAGFGYSQSNLPSTTIRFDSGLGITNPVANVDDTTVHTWATRTAAGVILYFRD
jgi:hypothetical protein